MIQPSQGYSGTPLAKKTRHQGRHPRPADSRAEELSRSRCAASTPRPILDSAQQAIDLAHVFATRRTLLATRLGRLRKSLDVHASIWVSWPKKAAKIPLDITEQTIRDVALPLGFVDIKVCAVDEVWSGLKLVVRKDLRPATD